MTSRTVRTWRPWDHPCPILQGTWFNHKNVVLWCCHRLHLLSIIGKRPNSANKRSWTFLATVKSTFHRLDPKTATNHYNPPFPPPLDWHYIMPNCGALWRKVGSFGWWRWWLGRSRNERKIKVSLTRPKSFYKRAVRHNLNASSAQNKLQRKLSWPKLATSREYKV